MRSIPVKFLKLSPFNVRRTIVRADIERLKSNILAVGLLQNLTVVEMTETCFHVVAGGQRLLALQELIKEGSVHDMIEVPCQVIIEKNSTLVSLSENVSRVAMPPVDEFKAYAAMVEKGDAVSTIALRFGVSARYVEQRMRMNQLDDSVVNQLSKGKITLTQAMAFTVTPDKKRQARLLKTINEHTRPDSIRRDLTQGWLASDSALAIYIGKDAYLAAGGVIREDLFGEVVFYENTELVVKLAREKAKKVADKLIAEGWRWVEVLPENSWEMRSKLARNHDEKPTKVLKALMGCFLDLNNGKDLSITTGYIRPTEAKAYNAISKNKVDGNQIVKPKKKPGDISQRLRESLKEERRQVMQCAIMADSLAANHLLCFAMIESLMNNKKSHFARGSLNGLDISFEDQCDEEFLKNPVGKIIATRRKEIADILAAVNSKNEQERYKQFCTMLTGEQKGKIFAFCVSLCLKPALSDSFNAIETALAQTGIKAQVLWRPTKDNYLSHVTRAELLKLTIQLFGKAVGDKYEKAKRPELVKMLDEAFSDPAKATDSPEAQKRIAEWLPAGFAIEAGLQAPVTKKSATKKKAA